MVTIIDVPSDVLLEIVSNLNLNQILSLLTTCSAIHRLNQSRYLWIQVLERTRDTRCLSCPNGEDLSQMDLQELQRIARHTYRLEKNWGRNSPRILGAVKARQHGVGVDSDDGVSIIAVIPGTDLVFLHSVDSRQLYCFDMQTMMRSPSLSLSKPICDAHYDKFGRHLMAVVSACQISYVLHVICTEYGHGRETTMREIFRFDLGLPVAPISHMIFVHADIVGVVMAHSPDRFALFVSVHNMITGVSIRIPVNPAEPINRPIPILAYVLEDNLHITMQAGRQYFSYHFCRDVLPYGDSLGNANGQLILDSQADHDGASIVPVAMRDSMAGLSTIAVRYPVEFADLVITEVQLYPSFYGNNVCPSGGTSAFVSLNAEVRVSRIENNPHKHLVAYTQSGAYTVLITDHTEDTGDVFTQLQLIHFIKEPPSINIRPLELPFFIDLNDLQSIAVDDHRGVVFLLHPEGYIFSVPYA